MARPGRYFIWLVMIFLLIVIPTTLVAQEETETASPPTATFTETATASPTLTSTLTATNTATSTTTETATATHTATVINTATATDIATSTDAPTETLAPSPELTAELTEFATEPVVEVTAELAPEVTAEITEETLPTSQSTRTAVATETEIISTANNITMYSVNWDKLDSYDFEDAEVIYHEWESNTAQTYINGLNAQALQFSGGIKPLVFELEPIQNLAFEVNFALQSPEYPFNISFRDTIDGAYIVQVYPNGDIKLLRNNVIVASGTMPPLGNNNWHQLHIEVYQDIISIEVDNSELLLFQDSVPLRAGELIIGRNTEASANFLVDDVQIWMPYDEIPWRRFEGLVNAQETQLDSQNLFSSNLSTGVDDITELRDALLPYSVSNPDDCPTEPLAIQLTRDIESTITLPNVRCSTVTIRGFGFSIRQSSSTGSTGFAFIGVNAGATLILKDLEILDFRFPGSLIYSTGSYLELDNVLIEGSDTLNSGTNIITSNWGRLDISNGTHIQNNTILHSNFGTSIIIANDSIVNVIGSIDKPVMMQDNIISVSAIIEANNAPSILLQYLVIRRNILGTPSKPYLAPLHLKSDSIAILDTVISDHPDSATIQIYPSDPSNASISIQNSIFNSNISNYNMIFSNDYSSEPGITIRIINSCITNNVAGTGSYVLKGSWLAHSNWWGHAGGPSALGTAVDPLADVSNPLPAPPNLAMGSNCAYTDPNPSTPNVIKVNAPTTQSLTTLSNNGLVAMTIPDPDDDTCTLREAIEWLNNEARIPPPSGVIDPACIPSVYDSTVPDTERVIEMFPATYLYAEQLPAIGNGVEVILRSYDPSTHTTIERIDTAGDFRLFEVASGGRLELQNIIVSNGRVLGDGGSIHNSGTLIFRNSAVIGNYASGNGGGIYNTGTLDIQDSIIQDNIADGNGGAIYHDGIQSTTVNNGCIVGNTGSGTSIFNNATNVISATDNWWGNASDPSVFVSGNVNYNPWTLIIPSLNIGGIGCTSSVVSSPSTIIIPGIDVQNFLFYPLPQPPQAELDIALALLQNPSNWSDQLLVHWDQNIYGSCTSSTRENCSRYAYTTFYAFFQEYTGNPPTLWDWLSATYFGEMGTWATSYGDIPVEALTRNFFTPTRGGCRYDSSTDQYICTYDGMILWGADIQFWIDTVANCNIFVSPDPNCANNPTLVRANISKMTGLDSFILADIGRQPNPVSRDILTSFAPRSGMFAYDSFIAGEQNPSISIVHGLPNWRGGPDANEPSIWGNEVLTTGLATPWTGLSATEHFAPIIVHLFSNGRTTQGYPNTQTTFTVGNTQLSPPTCTYIAVIGTTDGRVNLDTC